MVYFHPIGRRAKLQLVRFTCCLVTRVHILFENSVPTQSLVIWSYFETWFRKRDNRGPSTYAFADRPGKGEAAPSPQRPGQLVHWRVQPATRVVGKRFLSCKALLFSPLSLKTASLWTRPNTMRQAIRDDPGVIGNGDSLTRFAQCARAKGQAEYRGCWWLW